MREALAVSAARTVWTMLMEMTAKQQRDVKASGQQLDFNALS